MAEFIKGEGQREEVWQPNGSGRPAVLPEPIEGRAVAEGPVSESTEASPVDPYESQFPDLEHFIANRQGAGQKLKVCIATEDIVGPIRNGGIGTTYFYLARMLAEAGHETSIVYVRGDHCENESIDHWIDYYADFGVRFKALDPNDYPVNCPAPRWIRPMVALYEHLKQEHYDMVHVSEWRGTGYIAQSARAQGLALQDTLFCVKTSSPWLWNREYGFHTLGDPQDLPKIHAERRSVELGDLVVGGSRHLLCWMLEHGYRLPAGRTYVQPNVMVPADLDDVAAGRRERYGQRMPVSEVVFFGRLEYRKGLDVFCDAVDILLDRGVELPDIHLLGKIGEAIPSYSEFTTGEYIKHRTARWPMKVQIHTDRNAEQALRFLLDGDRLAVMPSIIENSSLAVYEACYYGVPFIASHRGGTPELVDEAHRDIVLTEPHPVPLAAKLEEALAEGGFIARPSFDNAHNLNVWRQFHDAVGGYLAEEPGAGDVGHTPSVSLCLVVNDDHEYAEEVLKWLGQSEGADETEVVIADNGSRRAETREWLAGQARRRDPVTVVRLEPWGEEHAHNAAAQEAAGELLTFMRDGALPKKHFFTALRTAAASDGADVFCCFYDEVTREALETGEGGTRQVFFADDANYGFFDPGNVSPALAVRRDAFLRMGGFREDFKVPGAYAEFVSMANLNGVRVTTIPEPIAWQISDESARARKNYKALPFRTIRPYLEHGSRLYTPLLLLARGGGRGRLMGAKGAQTAGDPMEMVEARARELHGELAGYGGLRSFGWRAYNAQHRVFQRLLNLEIMVVRQLVRLWRRCRGR